MLPHADGFSIVSVLQVLMSQPFLAGVQAVADSVEQQATAKDKRNVRQAVSGAGPATLQTKMQQGKK
jgi:hypothetical protein